jgi:hypothetical protein
VIDAPDTVLTMMNMTIEQLQKMHGQRPFQAFEFHLADGRAIPVEHPEFLSQTPTGRTISIGLRDGTHEVVDLLLVTSLKPHANGTSSAKRSRPR